MGKIIAIANQKGGVGKTTTCVNLGAGISSLGYKTLIIDMDPQANASIHLDISIHKLNHSMYDVLISQDIKLSDIILKTSVSKLDVAPSHINLSGAEIELVNMIGRERVLKEKVEEIIDSYDYILIDCPPSLGLLTLNSLTTAQYLIIPLQTEFFALEGIDKLIRTIEIVKNKLNHSLEILSIVPTLYTEKTKLAKEALEKITGYFKNNVSKTRIRRNVKLAESPSHGMPIMLYAPRSYGTIDYHDLSKEIVKKTIKV
ncbi:MAG: AAA family ATPase [bacterium]